MTNQEEKLQVLEEILGAYHKSGKEYLFKCFVCKHHKNKLSINLEKNCYKCWTCDFKSNSLKKIVFKHGNNLQKYKWEGLDNTIDLSNPFDDLFGDKQDKEILVELPKEFVSLTNKKFSLSSVEPRNYLFKRGLTKQNIVEWKIGYCQEGQYKNRIIVPSFNDEGRCNYFVARTFAYKRPSYLNPQASKNLIFNELFINWKDDIVLCEGIFDAIKAGNNSIPLLGSTLNESSKLFQNIVKNNLTVYVCLDKDAAKKEQEIIKKLLLYEIEVYKVDLSGFKDVGEMENREFVIRKNKATKISSENFIENMWRN